jgi:small multidrug resistance pump
VKAPGPSTSRILLAWDFVSYRESEFSAIRCCPVKWLYLSIAIVSEVIATSALKSSQGFSRLLPSVLVVSAYASAFYFLSLTLKYLPVGIAYAIWSGVGIMLISAIGVVYFRQMLDFPALVGIAFIIIGVFVLCVLSKSAVH